MSGVAERSLRLPRHDAETAASTVIAVAADLGYRAVATSPRTIRLVRERRGLLTNRADMMTVVVVEDRNGVGVRVTGAVDEEFLAAVSAADAGSAVIQSTHLSAAAGAETRSGRPSAPGMITAVPGAAPVPQVKIDDAVCLSADVAPTAHTVAAVPLVAARAESPPGSAHRAEAGPWSLLLPSGDRVALSGPVVLGRLPTVPPDTPRARAVSVGDSSVTKTHAVVQVESGRFMVRDLSSTNGTAVELDGVRHRCSPDADQSFPLVTLLLCLGDAVIRLEQPQ